MGCQELIDALRKECEERIRKIWQEAEAEAERMRTEYLKRIENTKEEYGLNRSSALQFQTDAILSESKNMARLTMLSAEKTLSERLYRLAVDFLPRLRDARHEDVFAALVKELPPCEWGRVKVNPEDKRIAQTYFPESEIIPDSTITGGLEVTEKNGSIRVISTFEKRLESAWTEMLPELMNDVSERYGTPPED